MMIQPYVFFDGRCEEAIEFYKKAVGAEVQMLMHFKDAPEPHSPEMCPPSNLNKVMHAQVLIGNSTVLMSDGQALGRPKFDGFSLSLTVDTVAEATRIFGTLSEGGQVMMPLGKTFFSPQFGMFSDKFGVGWMVYVKP
jgi:PhnB protein